MSAEQDQAKALAERIAARLVREPTAAPAEDAHDVGRELAALRASLGEVQQRLAHIESHVTPAPEETRGAAAPPPRANTSAQPGNPAAAGAPGWTTSTYIPVVQHPSQERFGIGEAVEELVDYFEREKTCNVEPGGKPCDHCAMCSSRGF